MSSSVSVRPIALRRCNSTYRPRSAVCAHGVAAAAGSRPAAVLFGTVSRASKRGGLVVRAAGNKPGGEKPGEKPDMWESDVFGIIFQGGYALVVVLAIAFLLNLAGPVLQTMENTFPK